MTNIRVILKNGVEFVIPCEKCTLTKSRFTGEITSYHFQGLSNISPMYIDMTQIVAVIQEDLESTKGREDDEDLG